MTAKHTFAGKVAIAGIGATEFSKESGRSELRLAVEAVKAALDDAGIAPSEVQGTCTYGADTNPDIDIARSLGFDDLTSSLASTTAAAQRREPSSRQPSPSPLGLPTSSSATGPSTSVRAIASVPVCKAGLPWRTPRWPTSRPTRQSVS